MEQVFGLEKPAFAGPVVKCLASVKDKYLQGISLEKKKSLLK
jgi:hypothetical protein